MINLEKCITVENLLYVLHDVTKVEYIDFFTCEEVYEPDHNRKIVTVCADGIDKIVCFVA